MRVTVLTVLAIVMGAVGCAGGEWTRVRSQDDPLAYRRFLREHPDSAHARDARERLEYLRLKRRPDLAAFERFRASYPNSETLPELEGLLEEPAFQSALLHGTTDAFQQFLARFPNGTLVERARGNQAYLEMGGAFASPERLAAFLRVHPESDYAEDARRTLRSVSLRDETRITQTGLRIQIDPSTPGARRLAARFRDRAEEIYRWAGLPLTLSSAPATATPIDAWLTIRHRETRVGTEVSDGDVSRPGLLATTEVTLTRSDEEEPFWSETFTFRTSQLDRREGTSILFTARAKSYWESFFVPIATWSTNGALRPLLPLDEPAVAVDVSGDRAGILFPNGNFHLVHLVNPSRPRVIVRYSRPHALEHFSGLRLVGNRVALFGEDGLEIVALDSPKGSVVRFLDRGRLGSVAQVERYGSELLVAGTRGLLRVSASGDILETLIGKPVRDLALAGSRIVLIDDQMLYVSGLDGLRHGRSDGQVRLGTGFGPTALRSDTGLAVVLSPRGLVHFDLSNPQQPRKLSWLRPSQTGRVRDAAIVAGHVFLLGDRGLQVLEPRSGRIVDSVDVEPRARMVAAGRYLVAVGAPGMEVVDASPWTSPSALASPSDEPSN